MASIGAFVEELAKNDALSDQFEMDPEGAMSGFGLSPEQIADVMTGDIKKLRKKINDDIKPKKAIVFRVKRG